MKFLSYLNSGHPNIRFTFETQNLFSNVRELNLFLAKPLNIAAH